AGPWSPDRRPWSQKPPCRTAARGPNRPGADAPSGAGRRRLAELRSSGIWVYSSLVAQPAIAAWESHRHSEKRLPTIQQLVRLGRRAARAKPNAPALPGSPQRRVVAPDPVYQSEAIAKFVNVVMSRGKRSTAEKVVYDALARASKQAKKEPLEVFDSALRNATPLLEVKPRRVGGATYQVPVEI